MPYIVRGEVASDAKNGSNFCDIQGVVYVYLCVWVRINYNLQIYIHGKLYDKNEKIM